MLGLLLEFIEDLICYDVTTLFENMTLQEIRDVSEYITNEMKFLDGILYEVNVKAATSILHALMQNK